MYGSTGNAARDLGPESGRLPDHGPIERHDDCSVVEDAIGFPVDALVLFLRQVAGVLLLGGA